VLPKKKILIFQKKNATKLLSKTVFLCKKKIILVLHQKNFLFYTKKKNFLFPKKKDFFVYEKKKNFIKKIQNSKFPFPKK